MFSSLLNFIPLPFKKYAIYAVIVLGVIGFAYTTLKIHDSGIRNEATATFNKLQLEKTLEAAQKLIKQNDQIIKNQSEILSSVKQKNDVLDQSLSKIDLFLSQDETIKKDKPSSDILKRTIESLKETK